MKIPILTRAHFNWIAYKIKTDNRLVESEDREWLTAILTSWLQETNPNFDSEKFHNACK